jgi:hypothetical protein
MVDASEIDETIDSLGLLHERANLCNTICIRWTIELPRRHWQLVEDLDWDPVYVVGAMGCTHCVLGQVLLNEGLHCN